MRAAPLAIALLVAGCGGSSLVDYEPRVHVVQPGETLYGIAWSYGLDHRDLARWNRLDDPNLIRAGQRIRLTPAAAASTARRSGGDSSGSSGSPSSGASRPAPRSGAAPASPAPRWHWPTRGRLVNRFGASGGIATGIAIAGREGQPVEAAGDGRVVYAGSGLIGYGQLVIIRHNATYLSAYGHNSRLLVEQGETIARGQTIAEMGLGPEREPRLHFEIRRNGTPVDPLNFLSPPG